MILTEKDIIEKAKFMIADQEAGANIPSFLAQWHDENEVALTAMLDAYIRLNMLEQLSLRITGMTLANLLNMSGEITVDEAELLRAKYHARVEKKLGLKM